MSDDNWVGILTGRERPMILTDFLLARIAEDEAVARLVDHSPDYTMQPFTLARVLAECEAKRRIVEMFSGDLHEKWDDGHEAEKMVEPILSTLALPYADHPDYREEWKP